MSAVGKVLESADFIGGQALGPQREDFPTGIGVIVFLCSHCDAKHLAISTIVEGRRQTVTVHGEDAFNVAGIINKGLASS